MGKEELKAKLRKNLYRKPDFRDKNFPKVSIWVGLLKISIGLGIGRFDLFFIQNSTKTTSVVLRLDGSA